MSNLSTKKTIRMIGNSISKHGPEILTGLGIAGFVTSIFLAVEATPRAMRLIDEANAETPKEKFKTAWRCYIPTVATAMVSASCIIGASAVNSKRNAALVTAYSLSESMRREYKNKIIEVLGKEANEKVENEIAKDRVEQSPIETKEVILTGTGDYLCYDVLSDRYFKADRNDIERAVNRLNRLMLSEMYISLNEFYDEIGLSHMKTIGDDIGWNVGNGLIEVNFSSQLTNKGEPCIVIDFVYPPEHGFQRY